MPIYSLGGNATILNDGSSAGSSGGGGTTPTAPAVLTATTPVALADWVQVADKYTFTVPAISGVTEVFDINAFEADQSVGVISEIQASGDVLIHVNFIPDGRFDGSITVIGA